MAEIFLLVLMCVLVGISALALLAIFLIATFEVPLKVLIGKHRNVVMRGYKGFNKPLTCRDFKFKVGKVFAVPGAPVLCENGFHFCRKLSHVFNFYNCDFTESEAWQENVYCEIEALGRIDSVPQYFSNWTTPKYCTDIIRIKRLLSWEEVKEIYNREKEEICGKSYHFSNKHKKKLKKKAKRAMRKHR